MQPHDVKQGNRHMKTALIILGVITLVPLAGCNKNGDEKLADRVENAADNRADALDKQAEVLKDRADQVRENGEDRSNAIDAADVNARAMTQAERDAIVANQAPAVR